MIQSISTINWFGVAAALVAYSALGALWFTLLFKKQYQSISYLLVVVGSVQLFLFMVS